MRPTSKGARLKRGRWMLSCKPLFAFSKALWRMSKRSGRGWAYLCISCLRCRCKLLWQWTPLGVNRVNSVQGRLRGIWCRFLGASWDRRQWSSTRSAQWLQCLFEGWWADVTIDVDEQTFWHFFYLCRVMDWAPSITYCASTRERAWHATWMIQLTYTASVTQWPVTIWTSFSFWHRSSTRPWWQVQEHEHYLSTQQWASTCIRATPHTYSGYHCPEKYFKHEH
jgi:hypothetical protein